MKFVLGTNSLANTTQMAYANHCQMWYLLGKRYPEHTFFFVNPPRMSIDRMRNLCATVAEDVEADYILFLDDDVLIPNPFDFLDKLLALDAEIAAGDVLVRGYPFNHMIFKWRNDEKRELLILPEVPEPRGPLACDAVGFSLCLIKTSILKSINKPYFITGANNTEDVYFCIKAQEAIPDIKIMVDTTISCGHILGPEIIDNDNKKAFSDYHQTMYGQKERDTDRGAAYLEMVKKGFGNA